MMKHEKVGALFFGIVFMAAPAAQAWSVNLCWTGGVMNWDGDHKRFDADSADFPVGSVSHGSVVRAVALTNQAPMDFTVGFLVDPTELVGKHNSESEIYWVESLEDAAAQCWWSYDPVFSCYLTEADVRINRDFLLTDNGFSFSTDKSFVTRAYDGSGSARLLDTTLVHEIGHCLGLRHENRFYNIMGAEWHHLHTNGDTANAYVGADATGGLRRLYGAANHGDNVALSHWAFLQENGDISAHRRVFLEPDVDPKYSDAELTTIAIEGEGDSYQVIRGQHVRAELGFENLGAHEHWTEVEFLFSEDYEITSEDLPVDLPAEGVVYPFPINLPPSTHGYGFRSVVIPTNAPGGDGALGAIIDPGNDIAESDETDNASYIPVTVIDPSPPTAFSAINETQTLEVDLNTGAVSLPHPVILSSNAGGYPDPFFVNDCRVNYWVTTGEPSGYQLTQPTISSPYGLGGSMPVELDWLPPGHYRTFAQTQCINDANGFGSELVEGEQVQIGSPLQVDQVAPQPPTNLKSFLFPIADPYNEDKVNVRLTADSFDLNGDPIRFHFVVITMKDGEGNELHPKPFFTLDGADFSMPDAGGTSLIVHGDVVFEAEAGTYVWIVWACDVLNKCSEMVLSEQFDISTDVANNNCNLGMLYCNFEDPGFEMFGVPPDEPAMAILDPVQLLSALPFDATHPVELRGTFEWTRTGQLVATNVMSTSYAPAFISAERMQTRNFTFFAEDVLYGAP